MTIRFTRRRALGALPVLLACPGAARANPADIAAASSSIENFHAALLHAMQNPEALDPAGRAAAMRPVMLRVFDMAAMTRIASGRAWLEFSTEQQAGLVAAFTDWTVATSLHRAGPFAGESFVAEGGSAQANGDVMVRSRIERPGLAAVPLLYLLRAAEGDFRVVDMYLSGSISELASRRADFAGLLRAGGADQLAASLRDRTAVMLR